MASVSSDEDKRLRWRSCTRVTMLLMLVGFVVTFGVSFFARELSFSVFGWPFSFWIASQGALVVYLVLVSVYARVMHRLDVRHGVAEDD
jgi:putative solute:sodium symporter small subunit